MNTILKQTQLLFITTSSLASNPRLVKEFEALKHEFSCHVLCFKHQDWSLELSETIKSDNPEVEFIEIDRKKALIETIFCKLIHKAAIRVNRRFPKHFSVCAFANSDKALQLWLRAKVLQKKIKFYRVIAHNLGAFYPAVKVAEKKNTDLQLDIEDYYPGEALYFNKTLEKQNRMQLMAHSFLKAESITYASKGIQLECEKHFVVRSQTKQLTIINAFKEEDFLEPKVTTLKPLKCVWFSQHIGPNRGLEQVFVAAEKLKDIEFHLIGNRNQDYLDTFDLSDNLIIHQIMNQESLHEFLNYMDIGLALENVNADHNRDICLTNKFLAYAQAGLYIVATNTFGQSEFLKSVDYNAGVIMTSSLESTLQNLDSNLLNTTTKIERWRKAKSFSWENEQLKLKQLLS